MTDVVSSNYRLPETKHSSPTRIVVLVTLIDLKPAGITRLGHEDFFAMLGRGFHRAVGEIYRGCLRADLSGFPCESRDRHLG